MVKVTKLEATDAIRQAREALVRARVLRAAIGFIESNSEANAPAIDVFTLHDIADELTQQALTEVLHVDDYFRWRPQTFAVPGQTATYQLSKNHEPTERIFLAEERRANGDDSSEFVMAILTNEETETAAYAKAERIAEKYDAKIIAAHDGTGYYRVVRE